MFTNPEILKIIIDDRIRELRNEATLSRKSEGSDNLRSIFSTASGKIVNFINSMIHTRKGFIGEAGTEGDRILDMLGMGALRQDTLRASEFTTITPGIKPPDDPNIRRVLISTFANSHGGTSHPTGIFDINILTGESTQVLGLNGEPLLPEPQEEKLTEYVKTEVSPVITSERTARIAKSFQENFAEVEQTTAAKVVTYTAYNSDPQLETGIFQPEIIQQLSREWTIAWGMPPYNEHLISKSAAISENSFDPPRDQKKGRPYLQNTYDNNEVTPSLWSRFEGVNSENDIEALLQSGEWQLFWSPERVKEYLTYDMATHSGFTGSLLQDENGKIIAWFIGYEDNPSVKVGKVIDSNGEEVKTAYYLDTGGISIDHRGRKNKKIKGLIADAISKVTVGIMNIYDGNFFTRMHSADRNVGNYLYGPLGFDRAKSKSDIDPEREYWIRTYGELQAEHSSALMEGTLIRLASRLVKTSGELYEKGIVKVEEFLNRAIDEMTTELKLKEGNPVLKSLTSLKEDILNGKIRIEGSKSALTDLILTGPIITLPLNIVVDGSLLVSNPIVGGIVTAFDVIPGPGGVAPIIYRALYLLSTMGVPEAIKQVRNGNGDQILITLLSCLGTSFDGGWVLTPYIKSTKGRAAIIPLLVLWKSLNSVKKLGSKTLHKVFNL